MDGMGSIPRSSWSIRAIYEKTLAPNFKDP